MAPPSSSESKKVRQRRARAEALEQIPDILARFDDIIITHARSLGFSQALILVLTVLLGFSYTHQEFMTNVYVPHLSLDYIDQLCIPNFDEVSQLELSWDVKKNVLKHVSPFDTFKIARHTRKKEVLLFYMKENMTLPKTFAQIVSCQDDSSSLMELNYGEYQNWSRMITFRDEFPFDYRVSVTIADVIVRKFCLVILPMVMLFVAATGADYLGRRQMTIYVCSLLFGLGCFCCNQTFVGYIWARSLWFFESKTSELLCQIILLETTTWHHRGILLPLTHLGVVMLLPVDAFSRNFFYSWRLYYLVTWLFPTTAFIVFLRTSVESPRWQLSRGKVELATTTIKYLAATNRVSTQTQTLAMDLDAIRETEFGTQDETSFWRYLRLQKRTVIILLFAYTAVLTTRAFMYGDVYSERAPNNWHIALFRVIASTASILVGMLVHRKGNYNYPVLVWCLLACVLLVYKTLSLNEVSEELHFATVYQMMELSIISFLTECLNTSVMLQIFHTSPTAIRGQWTALLVCVPTVASSLYENFITFPPHGLYAAAIIMFCAAVAQLFLPYVCPFINEDDLVTGRNLEAGYEKEAKTSLSQRAIGISYTNRRNTRLSSVYISGIRR